MADRHSPRVSCSFDPRYRRRARASPGAAGAACLRPTRSVPRRWVSEAELLVSVVGRQNVGRPPIGDAEGVLELFWLLATTILAWARPRHDLVLENLLLRHQLAVLTRPTRTRPRARLRTWDELLWILARRFCDGWREHLAIVTPETVVRWHRQGWRLVWWWKSRSRGGRPQLSPETQELIATMSRENRLWARGTGACQRDGEPDRGVGLATGDRGDALGLQPAASTAGSRCRVWSRLTPAGPLRGYRCHRHARSGPSGERHRRTRDWTLRREC